MADGQATTRPGAVPADLARAEARMVAMIEREHREEQAMAFGPPARRRIWIEITGATATGVNDTNGNPVQWTYDAVEVERTAAGYGGGNWQQPSGGWSGTAYNGAEDENASGSRMKSTGVDHGGGGYPAGFSMQAIQSGVKVMAEVLVFNAGTPSAPDWQSECWFTLANGEDGTCAAP